MSRSSFERDHTEPTRYPRAGRAAAPIPPTMRVHRTPGKATRFPTGWAPRGKPTGAPQADQLSSAAVRHGRSAAEVLR